MKLQYRITVKNGTKTVADITGKEGIAGEHITLAEVYEGVVEAEELLEKLTGYRFHIEQVS